MNWKNPWETPWVAGPLSGILLGLAFPSFWLFPLAWIGLIPWLRFLLSGASWPRTIAGHCLFGMAFFSVLLYWIPEVLVTFGGFSDLAAWPSLLLLTLVLATLILPFSLLTRWAASRSKAAALVAAPGFWLLTELFRTYYVAGGFPWGLLGYTQRPTVYLVQIADLSGVFLVSYLIVLGNAALLSMWIKLAGARRLAAATGCLLAAAFLYGLYRVHLWTPHEVGSVRTGLIQPDIGLAEDRRHYAEKYFETLSRYYRQAASQEAGWAIVSEAQNPFSFGRDFYYTTYWQRRTAETGVPLLFNSSYRTEEPEAKFFNSAFLLDGQGRVAYRYDKVRLVPFGEYVPWRGVLGLFYSPLVREVSEFSSGGGVKVGQMPGLTFSVLICFEAVFPDLSRQAANQGAELLVNITNDSWYGDSSAPHQLLQMTRLRAIETRRPVLRSANSGVTLAIDVWGIAGDRLPMFEEGLLTVDARGISGTTLYSQVGEWLNIMLVVAALATVASSSRFGPPSGRRGTTAPSGRSTSRATFGQARQSAPAEKDKE